VRIAHQSAVHTIEKSAHMPLDALGVISMFSYLRRMGKREAYANIKTSALIA